MGWMNKLKNINKTTIVFKPAFDFGVILFVIFLMLKLCGIITWSWWWVVSPLWIPFCLILLFVCLVLLVGTTMGILGLFVVIIDAIIKSRSRY
jgi:hypothetical protein